MRGGVNFSRGPNVVQKSQVDEGVWCGWDLAIGAKRRSGRRDRTRSQVGVRESERRNIVLVVIGPRSLSFSALVLLQRVKQQRGGLQKKKERKAVSQS